MSTLNRAGYVILALFGCMMLYAMRDVFLPSSDPILLEMGRRLDGIPQSEIPRSADNALSAILGDRLSFAMESQGTTLDERLQQLLREDFLATWKELGNTLRGGPKRMGPGELIWSGDFHPGSFCELMRAVTGGKLYHRVETGEVSRQEADRMMECVVAATT